MISSSLILLAALGLSEVEAFPNYAVLYKSTFTYLPSCTACHEQESWEPNDFGKDFLKQGRSRFPFENIAKKDSDGDGIANYLEIQAKSNPGDPHSTPKRPGDWLDQAGIRPPKKILAAAFPGSSDFKVREVVLDAAQTKALTKAWGETL